MEEEKITKNTTGPKQETEEESPDQNQKCTEFV
jgi:hypothetical protein